MISRRQFIKVSAVLAFSGILFSASLPQPYDPYVIVQEAQASNVVKSVHIVPSEDGTLYSRFPDGDAPNTGDVCDVPSGWDCANVGNGSGSITQISSTHWAFDVIGSNNREENRFAFKDAGGSDVQLIARIDGDAYTGNLVGFAGLAIGLRDSTAQSAWLHQCRVPAASSTTVSAIYRIDATTFQGANGAPGKVQPSWVAMTYDFDNKISKCHQAPDVAGSPGTWTEVQSVVHDYSDVIAYVSGNSSSDTIGLQGEVDNISLSSTITVYTPPNPPGGSAPVVVTPIPNQVKNQGNSFNLNCASNFHDPDNDPMVFTVSGLPTGTGISMNSACQFSGTFNANDIGTRNITVKADDQTDGFALDTFQLTVSNSTGTTYGPYGSGVAIIDCNSAETATIKGNGAGAGDTILLAGGNRGNLTIRDCNGNDSSPITVTNDPNASVPTVIRRESGSGTFVLTLSDDSNLVFGPDGNGAKFAGGHAGWCGVDPADNTQSGDQTLRWLEDGDTNCGIVVTRVAGVSIPTAYIKGGGLFTKLTIQGVEVDGLNSTDTNSPASGIGMSMNDHSVKEEDHPTFWREDLNAFHMYIHDVGWANGGEGLYFGPNGYGQDPGDSGNDLPLRRVRIAYNLLEDIASDCVNPKYWLQGPNFIDHNHLYRCGLHGGNGEAGIAMLDGGEVDITSNLIITTGANGIQCSIASAVVSANDGSSTLLVNGHNQIERDKGPYYCLVYNNIIVGAGNRCFGSTRTDPPPATGKPGIRAQIDPIRFYNNTCVNPVDVTAVSIASSLTGVKVIRDNIIADTGCSPTGLDANDKIATGGTGTVTNDNNGCDIIANWSFVASGSNNYHIQSGSPARNNSTTNAPPIDFDGDVRPQQLIDDLGADEYVP